MNQYNRAYEFAYQMLCEFDGLEIRSALKQAASDVGIEEGDDMSNFVHWAEDKLFSNSF